MAATCKFCSTTHQIGEIFCSREQTKAPLANGAMLVKALGGESENHTARLTVCRVQNGVQQFTIKNKLYSLQPGEFLILNNGQEYNTFWEGKQGAEVSMIGFSDAFAAQFMYAQITSDSKLLDSPQGQLAQPFQFFTKLNEPNPVLDHIFDIFKQQLLHPQANAMHLDSLYGALLSRLIGTQRQLHQTIGTLAATKHSTRVELYQRLTIARDYIDAHIGSQVSLEDAASEACLSKFHFMRLFKQAFGQTVHQYITQNRLKRTRLLLETEQLAFSEICRQMGYEDVAWFAKVYKRTFGSTPGRERKNALHIAHQQESLAVA